jgi:phosphoribosyl 1,2-cyclic phosphodiesterase
MNTEIDLTVKFWGTRGSHPAPGNETLVYGGNTACVELRIAGHTIILDAGTGIIGLGAHLLQRSIQSPGPIEATILFSHLHHDHTQGFPFFKPAFIPSTRLHLVGPQPFGASLENILSHSMEPPVFPITLNEMPSKRSFWEIGSHQTFLLSDDGVLQELAGDPALSAAPGQVCIRSYRSYAHPGGVLIYRIDWQNRTVVYATDTEGYVSTDRRLVAFARGADLLIHDAQYTEDHYLGRSVSQHATQGWGHSTAAMACEVARAAQVKRLALFHYDPDYSDQMITQVEAAARRLFKGAFAPREGMEINLGSGLPVHPPTVERPAAWAYKSSPSKSPSRGAHRLGNP